MTSKPSDSSTEASTADNDTLDASVESSAESTAKPAIPAFSFPFSPATFAPGKGDNQPWHQKGNKSAHEKKIGAAPPGTRRSMGKR
ncbi:hypothetical protein [Aquipseudomonas ullengensis]|uniref:Uncharacterized protein n=1 Tax=Aquipseudomonas ullengensis TaxID=2759166 RepID=A0A7W4LKI3_9GAMM|nr:hypothetical protein [Pseudomonas ullengensis]MBB2494847.1 hypothetical protein [Pseudomonas ullengensis]